MSPLSAEDLVLWSRYIQSICGLQLDSSKGYLIETRLSPLLRETGSANLAELYKKLRADASNGLRRKVIDAITTGETSFFRDTSPFELLQHKIIPDLIDKRSRASGNGRPIPIRIWSAACSTGQEVYSVGIAVKEVLVDLNRYDVRILGTDISDKAFAQASYGHFSKLEMDRGMAAAKTAKYFAPEGQTWKIRDEIRALATFKTMNLLEPFALPARFDIVLCRNVAIYFSEQDKIRLFKSISKAMAPDGYLIIGSTESITGVCQEFEAKRYLRAVFYQLRNGG
ncbi:MAG: protein-glutamate O-methyltransferase CheR [Syntrophobacteraceae bacterium]